MTVSFIIILAVCGILTNIMSALFGIGGGVLMVPILHTLFPTMPLQMVAATSLTIVMGTASINLIYFYKQKIKININKLLLWSVAMIIGVQLGFWLSFHVADIVIVSVFVVTLVCLAFKTFIGKKDKQCDSLQNKNDVLKGSLACLFGGGVAGITGIGGGSIMSPLIGQLPSVSVKQIAVYTNYMMVLGGIGNLYGYLHKTPDIVLANAWQVGYVNFSIVLIVVLSSFLMSFISMKIRGVLRPDVARKLLAIILLVIALYMLVLQFI